ncbi:MAG TPA: hypothetical protein VFU03_11255 [Gemmatimonadales bacterium]|nr:hypothetical protein [Gemmatimonadales bacterium]
MDFESIVKIIVVAITAVGVPVAAYAAIVATRAIWVKPGQHGDKVEELGQEVEALRARLNEVEGQQNRIAELEERLDFAERLLAQSREPERLPRA